MRVSAALFAMWSAGVLVGQPAEAWAQAAGVADRAASCNGLRVSAVDVVHSDRGALDRAHAPAFVRALLTPLLYGTPSRAGAITPWLQIRVGMVCSDLRLRESERLLRLLPYIADARVSFTDDGAGGVRATVETTDDIRPIIGAGLRGSRLTDVELGSNSLDGSGHLLAARWRDGGAFRDFVGVRYADYHLFGGANLGEMAYARTPLGSVAKATISRPFLTDLQHTAAFAGYLRDDGYVDFARTDGEPLSVRATRERFDAGFATRVSTRGQGSWLAGVLLMQERRTAGDDAVRITDRGLFDTTSTDFANRFGTASATRVGAVLGVRALQFVKATAFDGLESVQDMGRGVQLSAVYGRDVTRGANAFLSGDLYAGVGNAASFVGVRVQGEAREDARGWGNSVLSGRLAWYSRPSPRQTRVVSVEYAGAATDSVPFQLSIADGPTGLRGYSGSRLSGGRRLIARAERRVMLPGIVSAFGWGAAAFVDAGQMWAARVPFGESAFRGSAGVALLAAVPRASRSLARVDIAYPLVPDAHAKGVDVRVSYRVAARAFWREPFALSRVRVTSPTTDIFSWP
jgi:hypothetical protein